MYRAILALACSFVLSTSVSAQSLVERFTTTANEVLVSIEQTDIAVRVVTPQEFRRQSNMPLSKSLATAIYQQGQCTIVVDDRQLSSGVRRGVSVDAKVLQNFVFVHELGHCVSHHRQALEFNRLAQNQVVETAMFLNPKILKEASAGSLTQASYVAIVRSPENERREELFADSFALLHVCKITPTDCAALYETIASDRERSTQNGDHVHSTQEALKSAYAEGNRLSEGGSIVYIARGIMASIADI